MWKIIPIGKEAFDALRNVVFDIRTLSRRNPQRNPLSSLYWVFAMRFIIAHQHIVNTLENIENFVSNEKNNQHVMIDV